MNRQLFEYHPVIGYRFIPGLRTRQEHEGGGFLIRTNRAGYRCLHEFAREKKPGTFRILLFGDSYTAGMGVSDRQRYGDLLEQLVPGAEVYNFGLPGSGTDQQYLIYREEAPEIEHDLLVLAIMVENIRRIVARFRPFDTLEGRVVILAKPYFTLEPDGRLELHHVPVPREPLRIEGDRASRAHVDRFGSFSTLRALVNRLGPGVKDRIQRATRYQPLPAYDRPEGADWKLLEAIVARWAAESRAPVVVVPVPLYQYVEQTASPAAYQARFASLGALRGVEVHDPLPDFHRYSAEERRGFRYRVDCHLTPSAHRVLAESLARRIAPRVREALGRAA